jgi:CII-binding regulator of phage lambda lysogenization HflD
MLAVEMRSMVEDIREAFFSAERAIVEHLWSRADANSGNRWQVAHTRKRLKQAKTVATGYR